MCHIDCDVFSVNGPVDHQYISGLESFLFFLIQSDGNLASFESERNGFAVNIFELVRPVKETDVHASVVRPVIVDYLVVGRCKFRKAHEVFEYEPVFDFTDTQNCVIDTVFIPHRIDYTGDVVQFLFIFGLRPLVLSFRKELFVILDRIVIDVEKIFDIVESDDIILLLGVSQDAGQQENRQKKYLLHKKLNCQFHQESTSDSTLAAVSSPILSGRLTNKSQPILSSSSSIVMDWSIMAFLSLSYLR